MSPLASGDPPPAAAPACSVIVPSYDDGAKLARCLDSLAALDPPEGGFEVVVALDGSRDGSRELLARGLGEDGRGPLDDFVRPGAWSGLALRVVELPENRGRSAARNAALGAARGEWLLFLDADLAVRPGWARALRACQDKESTVSVGGMVYVIEDGQGRRLPLKRYQHYLQTRGPYKHRADDSMPPRYFYTCNSCVHRSLLDAAGAFDEAIRGWGGEDIDMGLKLGEAGARLVYCPEATAEHAQERSFRGHCDNLERMGREILPGLLARHRELKAALSLPTLEQGPLGRLLRAAVALRLHRAMLVWEEATDGLGFSDRVYDLCVFLHYGRGYLEASAGPARGSAQSGEPR